MKSFHSTVIFLITLFLIVMGCVTAVSYQRQSNSTGIDPALIKKIREKPRQ